MARVAIIPNLIIKLLQSNHMLSAFQILELLEESGNQFNKTSVYRALDKLLAEGKICKQSFGNTEFQYELRDAHHDHAVCTECKKIIAVHCQNHSHQNVPGFSVDHHHTTLYGVCESCVR